MALSRPVTALDNERFTVQSVMLKCAVPIVLVGLTFKPLLLMTNLVPKLPEEQASTSQQKLRTSEKFQPVTNPIFSLGSSEKCSEGAQQSVCRCSNEMGRRVQGGAGKVWQCSNKPALSSRIFQGSQC